MAGSTNTDLSSPLATDSLPGSFVLCEPTTPKSLSPTANTYSSLSFGGANHQLMPLAVHSQEPIDTVLSEGHNSTPPLMVISQTPKTPLRTPFILEGYTGRNIRYSSPLSAIRDSDAFVEWLEAYILRRSYEYGNLDTLAQEQSPSTPTPINNCSDTAATYCTITLSSVGGVTEHSEPPAPTAVGDLIEQSDTSAGFPTSTLTTELKTSEQTVTAACSPPLGDAEVDLGPDVPGEEIPKNFDTPETCRPVSPALTENVTGDANPSSSGILTAVGVPMEQSDTSHTADFPITTATTELKTSEDIATGSCTTHEMSLDQDVSGEQNRKNSGVPAISAMLVRIVDEPGPPGSGNEPIGTPTVVRAHIEQSVAGDTTEFLTTTTLAKIHNPVPTSTSLCVPRFDEAIIGMGSDVPQGEIPKDSGDPATSVNSATNGPDRPQPGKTIEQPNSTHSVVSPLSSASTIQTSNSISSGLCMPVPTDVAISLARDIGEESPKDTMSGTSVAQNDKLVINSSVEGSINLESSISCTDTNGLKYDANANTVTAIDESTTYTLSKTSLSLNAVIENSEPGIITTGLKADEGFHTSVAINSGVVVASGAKDSHPNPPSKILQRPGTPGEKFNPVESARGTSISVKMDEYTTSSEILAVVIENSSHAKAAVNPFTRADGGQTASNPSTSATPISTSTSPLPRTHASNNSTPTTTTPTASSTSSLSNEISPFRIKRLLKKRKHRGETQYLVEWQGYPRSQAHWEPERTLREDMGDPEVWEELLGSLPKKRKRRMVAH
ncbi:hypothetical protein BDD12DRAFT_944605 [Trichophaea hybrida]|nr:hypothetical protein BDD12DRAFT_944605 [Trichophaea hybrida]